MLKSLGSRDVGVLNVPGSSSYVVCDGEAEEDDEDEEAGEDDEAKEGYPVGGSGGLVAPMRDEAL